MAGARRTLVSMRRRRMRAASRCRSKPATIRASWPAAFTRTKSTTAPGSRPDHASKTSSRGWRRRRWSTMPRFAPAAKFGFAGARPPPPAAVFLALPSPSASVTTSTDFEKPPRAKLSFKRSVAAATGSTSKALSRSGPSHASIQSKQSPRNPPTSTTLTGPSATDHASLASTANLLKKPGQWKSRIRRTWSETRSRSGRTDIFTSAIWGTAAPLGTSTFTETMIGRDNLSRKCHKRCCGGRRSTGNEASTLLPPAM
mmetsp:Transcript_45821/g.127114  ORF Transcript_45821/g.127114 Transcript_45821/m.127114 type:complete len:257 (+) Transcript_45821:118-888(+)